MSQPLVSVVTPSYNQVEFIEDTLQSVKNQSYEPVEHVVVDGESDDGTHDVLRRHERDYNLNWRSAPDEGQSDAINTGFDRSNGDIVGWLNSDDVYFDTDVLKRVVRYFDRHDADVIYGDLAYIDADSVVKCLDIRPDFNPDILTYRSTIGQPAAFFRQEVLTNERLDPEFHYTMDWEFWIRLSHQCGFEFLHVPDVLAGFRRHEAQKTENQQAMEEEFQRLRQKHDLPVGAMNRNIFTDVGPTEVERLLANIKRTYLLHRYPPELAFNGRLAPLPSMIRSLGPNIHDIQKSLRRWRSA